MFAPPEGSALEPHGIRTKQSGESEGMGALWQMVLRFAEQVRTLAARGRIQLRVASLILLGFHYGQVSNLIERRQHVQALLTGARFLRPLLGSRNVPQRHEDGGARQSDSTAKLSGR